MKKKKRNNYLLFFDLDSLVSDYAQLVVGSSLSMCVMLAVVEWLLDGGVAGVLYWTRG